MKNISYLGGSAYGIISKQNSSTNTQNSLKLRQPLREDTLNITSPIFEENTKSKETIQLLEIMSDIKHKPNSEETAKKVLQLISQGANINAKDSIYTLLQYAVLNNDVLLASIFLACGADLTTKGKTDEAPLQMAQRLDKQVKEMDRDVHLDNEYLGRTYTNIANTIQYYSFKETSKKDTDSSKAASEILQYTRKNGYLQWALKEFNSGLALTLLAKDPKQDFKNNANKLSDLQAITQGENLGLVNFLLKHHRKLLSPEQKEWLRSINISKSSNQGNSSINAELRNYIYTKDACLEGVMDLEDRGADIIAADKKGSLLVGVFNPDIAEYLISKGADLRENEDVVDYSPFHNLCAAYDRCLYGGKIYDSLTDAEMEKLIETAKVLLKHNANVNQKASRDERQAISEFWFNKNKNLKMLELLHQHGADINSKDSNNSTPLHITYSPAVAEYYINNGALLNEINIWKKTPLDEAINDSKPKIAALLIKNDAELNLYKENIILENPYAQNPTSKNLHSKNIIKTIKELKDSHPEEYEKLISKYPHFTLEKLLD